MARFDSPRDTQYTFYIAAKDKMGNYSESNSITIFYPEMDVLINEAEVKVQNNIVEIKMPKVQNRIDMNTGDILSSQEREQREVLGFVVRLINKDYEGNTFNDRERWISSNEIKEESGTYYATFEIPKYSSWDIEIGAYDSVTHPDYNPTLFENTFKYLDTISPPSTPNSLNLNINYSTKNLSIFDTNNFEYIQDADSNIKAIWSINTEPWFDEYYIEKSSVSDFSIIDNTFYQSNNSLTLNGLGSDELIYLRFRALGGMPLFELDWSSLDHTEVSEYEIRWREIGQETWESAFVDELNFNKYFEFKDNIEFKVRAINNNGLISNWSNTISGVADSNRIESNTVEVSVDMPSLLSSIVDTHENAWENMSNLLQAGFYQDGSFIFENFDEYSGNNLIAETVQTQALAVGSRFRNFTLDGVTFEPNYNDDYQKLNITSGSLIMISAPDDTPDREVWSVPSTVITVPSDDNYYIYATVHKVNNDLTINYSITRPNYENGDYYNFVIGIFNTTNNPSIFSSSYGFTFIDGNKITTGTIDANNVNITGGGGAVELGGFGLQGGTTSNGSIDTVNFEINTLGEVSLTGNVNILGGEGLENLSDSGDLASMADIPSGSGLFLNSTNLGFYDNGTWKTFMNNQGQFYLGGETGSLQWDGTNLIIDGGGIFKGTLQGVDGDFSGTLSGGTITGSRFLAGNKTRTYEETETNKEWQNITTEWQNIDDTWSGFDSNLGVAISEEGSFDFGNQDIFIRFDKEDLYINTPKFSVSKGNAEFGGELLAASGRLGDNNYYVNFDGTNLDIKTTGLDISGGSAEFSGTVSAITGDFEELHAVNNNIRLTENEIDNVATIELDGDNNKLVEISSDSSLEMGLQNVGGSVMLNGRADEKPGVQLYSRNAFPIDLATAGHLDLYMFENDGSIYEELQVYSNGMTCRASYHDTGASNLPLFEFKASGIRHMDLPTSDPGSEGVFWNDNGTLKISSG